MTEKTLKVLILIFFVLSAIIFFLLKQQSEPGPSFNKTEGWELMYARYEEGTNLKFTVYRRQISDDLYEYGNKIVLISSNETVMKVWGATFRADDPFNRNNANLQNALKLENRQWVVSAKETMSYVSYEKQSNGSKHSILTITTENGEEVKRIFK